MNIQFLIQAMLSKGIGNVALKRIIFACEHYPEFDDMLCENPSLIQKHANLSEVSIKSMIENQAYAASIKQEMDKKGIYAITENDRTYPKQLRTTLGKSCPAILFLKGNPELLSAKSVGFCGSRKASPKGLRITEQCAAQLVHEDITIVSGYASGTDLTAHMTAMRSGGNTIFVLAEGLLKSTEKMMVKDLLTPSNHLFVSQFLPNQSWTVGNAMNRNQVIIGLSQAMILVESGKSGGTFAAGEEALRRKKPLFVIDYENPAVTAEANSYFIEKGGSPIRGKDGRPVLKNIFRAIGYDNGMASISNESHTPKMEQLQFLA